MDKLTSNNGIVYPAWVSNQYEQKIQQQQQQQQQQQFQSSRSSSTTSSSSNQRFMRCTPTKIRQRQSPLIPPQSPLLPPQSPTPFNTNTNPSARTSTTTTPFVTPCSSRRNSQQSILHFHKCDNSNCFERAASSTANHSESCSLNNENENVKRIVYVEPADDNDSRQIRSTSKPIERKIVSANGRMRASSVSEDKYYNYYRSVNSPLAYIETIAIKKEGSSGGSRGGVIIRRPKNAFYSESRSARSTPGRNLSSRDEFMNNELDQIALNDAIIKKFSNIHNKKGVNVYRFSNEDNYSKSGRSTPKSLGFKTHKSQLFATIHPNINYSNKVQ